MLGDVLIVLVALIFVWQAVRTVSKGELSLKGSIVIRRADDPLPFYLLVGGLLFFAATV